MRPTRRITADTLLVFLLLASCAPHVHAQGTTFQATYDRGHLTTPDWRSLGGLSGRVTFAGALWGLDLGFAYSRLSDRRPELLESCGFAFCTPGPFRHTVRLDVFGAGLERTMLRSSTAELILSTDLVLVVQGRRLTHAETGETSTSDQVTDLGIGPTLTLRFRPLAGGLRPVLHAGYQRVLETTYVADGTSYASRNLLRAGLGVAWRP